MFWPIVIALGPGFAAIYYDHDVKSFADRVICEQTLPGLDERAREARDFMAAVSEAAGDQLPNVVYRPVCVDKTPQQFEQDLKDQGKETDT